MRADACGLVETLAGHTSARWAAGDRTSLRGRVGVQVGEEIWDLDASDLRESGVAVAGDLPLAPGNTAGTEVPVGRRQLAFSGELIRTWTHEGIVSTAFAFLGATGPEKAYLRDSVRRLRAAGGDPLRASYRNELQNIFGPITEPT